MSVKLHNKYRLIFAITRLGFTTQEPGTTFAIKLLITYHYYDITIKSHE